MEKLKTFWVSCGGRGHNFGDEAGSEIVHRVSGREIEHVDVDRVAEAEIIGVGSVLQLVPADFDKYIWGSGIIQDDNVFRFPNAKIRAVRGKLTAKRLGIKDTPLGDPLLLWETVKTPKFTLGIVPHYVDFEDPSIWEFAKTHEDVLVIDMLARDAADRIATCDVVLSSALHGLVIADAIGIPNLWTLFSDNKIVGHGFKFRDYYTAFDIEDPIPLRFNGAMTTAHYRKQICDNWTPRPLDKVRHDLLEAFPKELL